VLSKEYKYVPPPTAANEKADENGITESMVDFSWDRDITMTVSVKMFFLGRFSSRIF
jgi:template-activating factor I